MSFSPIVSTNISASFVGVKSDSDLGSVLSVFPEILSDLLRAAPHVFTFGVLGGGVPGGGGDCGDNA